VIIVGPGAAGKTTLARRLGEITGLPVIELDKHFWRPGLAATPRDQWAAVQRELAGQESWIMDGDLGPYDVLDVRLRAADTIVFLDFSPARCAWRAIRRSRERADFWWWLLTYRRKSRPLLLQAIAEHAGDADIHILPTPRTVRRFLAQAGVLSPPVIPAARRRTRGTMLTPRARRTDVKKESVAVSRRWCEATIHWLPSNPVRIHRCTSCLPVHRGRLPDCNSIQ
jgi:adenylate kinase family enzyme